MIPPPMPAAARAAARDAVQAYLRSADHGEDALVEQVAATAMLLCEAFVGRALIVREWTETMPASRAWQALGIGPVQAIIDVAALPATGVASALPVESYAVDIDAEGIGWVRIEAAEATRVSVTFVAGIAASWETLAEPLRQGIVVLAAHLAEARTSETAPPAAVAALWRPWRRMRLAVTERCA